MRKTIRPMNHDSYETFCEKFAKMMKESGIPFTHENVKLVATGVIQKNIEGVRSYLVNFKYAVDPVQYFSSNVYNSFK